MSDRIPSKKLKVTVKKSVRPQTADEQKHFEAAIDTLIGELVDRELDRRMPKDNKKSLDAGAEA